MRLRRSPNCATCPRLRDSARIQVEALPEMLPELSKVEREHLVMALIHGIDMRGNNQVKITLRLAPDVVHNLPILR